MSRYKILPGGLYEHVVITERALGTSLPKGAIVHHVDEDPTNNSPSNLVVLQNQKEHMQLHARMRVRDAGGCVFKDKICSSCRQCVQVEGYNKDRSTYDGLCHRCRDCCAAHAKNYPSKWGPVQREQQRVRRAR